MANQKRDECAVCGNDRPLNQDGTFRAHRWGGIRCGGSGLTPDAARQANDFVNSEMAEPALVPDVVASPGTEIERAPAQPPARRVETAIEAAAEAALAHPGVAGRDEFLSLAMQARILSMSGAAPEIVRGDPHLAFHMALVGRDLGISPSAALELIDPIPARSGVRLSLSPQLMTGQLRRLGLGAVRPITRTKERAVAGAYGPDGTLLGESEFTWEDAIDAGLVDDRCEPSRHWRPNSGQGKCTCNQGYRTYPKRMLWWRAAGFAADDYFPEAGLGMYQPEALGAIVDDDGRPLDPAAVALPDGYDAPASHGNGHARGTQPEELADGHDLWVLQARCWALPAEQQAKLRAARKGNERLRDARGVIPTYALTESSYRILRSLVQGLESEASRGEWVADEALADVLGHCHRQVLFAMLAWAGHPWGLSGVVADVRAARASADPEPPGGAPAAIQPPETGDGGLAEDPKLAISEEVEALSLDEVRAVLAKAQVAISDDDEATGEDHLRDMLVDAIAANRGIT